MTAYDKIKRVKRAKLASMRKRAYPSTEGARQALGLIGAGAGAGMGYGFSQLCLAGPEGRALSTLIGGLLGAGAGIAVGNNL